ncbi:MAG TPA: AAA family ATPase, partial [Ktedonobacterales bacterium]|nr:AAA family ATPase [Ktedonobacterales bacterium]
MQAPSGIPVRCPLLVGRAAHLEALRRLLDAANGRNGQMALISGEAGVGKSRLTAEIAAKAMTEGFFVLQGRCFEQDASSPYAPLIDLLRSQFASHTLPARVADLEPAARELLLLLPGIFPPPRDLVMEPAIDPEAHQQRLVAALSHHLFGLADHQPLLLVLEDLQWSDDASLEILLHLTRLSTARPICLLATYRSDDAGTRLQHWLAQIDRERAALELRLERLTADEVAEMLKAIFTLDRPARPEFVETLYALTEGNPFFIEEVLTALIAEGGIFYGTSGWDRKPLSGLRIPRSVQDAVRQRVERLSEGAKQALMLAAVIGRRFDYPLLGALTHLDDPALMHAVKELIGAQLVVEETADQFAFRHALTRQAVYADLLARERRSFHRTVAELIESQYPGDAQERRLGELAYHYTEAQVWTKALTYARRAGDQARMLYAPQAAVEQYTRALMAAEHVSLAPAGDLHLARAASFELLGNLAAARSDYADALRLARRRQDAQAQWEALLALGALHAGFDYSQAGTYVAQALDVARELGDPIVIARSLNRVGNWHLNAERPERALAFHLEALATAEASQDLRSLADTLDLLGMTCNILGDPRQSSAYYERAIPLFRELDDREGLVNSLIIQVLQSGSYWHDTLVPAILSVQDAMSAQEEALRTAREIGWPTGEAYVLYEAALWHGPQGNYA